MWETLHVFCFSPQLHFSPHPPVSDGLQVLVWSCLCNITWFIRISWGWRFIAAITRRLNMMVLSIDLSPESHSDCVAPPSGCGSKRPQSEETNIWRAALLLCAAPPCFHTAGLQNTTNMVSPLRKYQDPCVQQKQEPASLRLRSCGFGTEDLFEQRM